MQINFLSPASTGLSRATWCSMASWIASMLRRRCKVSLGGSRGSRRNKAYGQYDRVPVVDELSYPLVASCSCAVDSGERCALKRPCWRTTCRAFARPLPDSIPSWRAPSRCRRPPDAPSCGSARPRRAGSQHGPSGGPLHRRRGYVVAVAARCVAAADGPPMDPCAGTGG